MEPGLHLVRPQLQSELEDESTKPAVRLNTAKKLAFLQRLSEGEKIAVSCLEIGDLRVLFMPGELFVEYQLAAQAMRPDLEVLMAAYGEYGTGYIGTRVAYPQGGYEVSERASNVADTTELRLVQAMRTLLNAEESRVLASDFTESAGRLPRTQEGSKVQRSTSGE